MIGLICTAALPLYLWAKQLTAQVPISISIEEEWEPGLYSMSSSNLATVAVLCTSHSEHSVCVLPLCHLGEFSSRRQQPQQSWLTTWALGPAACA